MGKKGDDLSFQEFKIHHPQLAAAIAALPADGQVDPEEAMSWFEGGSIWVDDLANFRVSDALPSLFVIPEMSDDSQMGARILFAINLSKGREIQVNMGNPTCQATIFEAVSPGLALLAMWVMGEGGLSWVHVIHRP